MRVLVVEDQPVIAFALCDALEEHGHEILGPALSAEAASQLVSEIRPDVAFVDIDLEYPHAGLQLAHTLTERLGIPIIFTTGQLEVARRSSIAYGLLAKPFSMRDAVAALDAIQLVSTGHPVHGGAASLEIFAHDKFEGSGAKKHGADCEASQTQG